MTGGRVTLRNAHPASMDAVLAKLVEAGAEVIVEGDRITLDMHGKRCLLYTSSHPYAG